MKTKKLLTAVLVASAMLCSLATACAPAHEHTYSTDWSKDATHHWHAATCEHSEEVADKAEHNWDEGEVTTEPTCTVDGVKTFTCEDCGQTKTEAVDATGHAWDEGTVTLEATCLAVGETTYTCTVCEETTTEEIALAEHVYSEDFTYDENGHWHVCTTQGCDSTTESVDHDYGNDGVVTTEATCEEEGVMTYYCECGAAQTEPIAATDHDYNTTEWESDAESHWHACQNDGCDSAIDVEDHEWDEGEVTTEATTEASGVMTYTCTVCESTYTESIPRIVPPINADEINRFEAESAEFGDVDGAEELRVETNENISGGQGVAYFQTNGQTLTFIINASAAMNNVTIVLGVAPANMSYETFAIPALSATDLANYARFTLNGSAVTFGGETLPAPEGFNFWEVGQFTATVNLVEGNNTFVITNLGTSVNVDYIEVRT